MNVVIRGRSRNVATVGNDELRAFQESLDVGSPEYKNVQKELSSRPQAHLPEYKPVTFAKEKDAAGVDRDVAVGGYQSFSGGSRQTTERKKGVGIPAEWV